MVHRVHGCAGFSGDLKVSAYLSYLSSDDLFSDSTGE
jgi:hypothetical protein